MASLGKAAVSNINLFAGAGGLAIGLNNAGFSPLQLYEINKQACATLIHNVSSPKPTIRGKVHETDVQTLDWSSVRQPVTLLAGGVPCQPFSLGGKHLAHEDGRNLFPEAIRAVRDLRPAVVLLENVRGLLRPGFRPYFDYIVDFLGVPSLSPGPDELWQNHHERILKRKRAGRSFEPEYQVEYRTFVAADFGVPQLRERVFIIATRSDIPRYAFPNPTHSRSALIRSLASGEYWDRYGVPKPMRPIHNQGPLELGDGLLPWVTVRDALANLRPPALDEAASRNNHWLVPGARTYSGHSGSTLDWPAKTIKAGVHGVPGGENTLIVNDRGDVRYFTLRELARIQTFPDDHYFVGARTHVARQIGNAVPCLLSAAVAEPLFELLQDIQPLRVAMNV